MYKPLKTVPLSVQIAIDVGLTCIDMLQSGMAGISNIRREGL